MLRIGLAMAALLGPAWDAPAREPAAFPKGQPPHFVQVVGLGDGGTILRVTYAVTVPVTETVRVAVDNGRRFEDRTVTVYRQEVRQQAILLKAARAVTAGGKKVEGDAAWKGLEGKLVALVRDPKGLDPAYVKLLARDTVIITVGVPPPEKP